jgi:hypothetical protein
VRKSVKIGLFVTILVFASMVLWFSAHTDDYDPRNLQYVCWKHGFCKIDPQRAIGVMLHDPSAASIVVGKTKGQLAEKFGFTTPLDQASPYLQSCYRGSGFAGKDVAFLRRSDWMVVFADGKVANLVLVKGC